MESEEFEEQLTRMSKPGVNHLKHQDMLAEAIVRAKDKSVLSGWWLSIPLYIIAALMMKSLFKRSTTFTTNVHGFKEHNAYIPFLLFVLMPAVFIVVNFISIRKIYFLSGSPKTFRFLSGVWFHVLAIMVSLFIMIIYSL